MKCINAHVFNATPKNYFILLEFSLRIYFCIEISYVLLSSHLGQSVISVLLIITLVSICTGWEASLYSGNPL